MLLRQPETRHATRETRNSRRDFLQASSLLVLGALLGCDSRQENALDPSVPIEQALDAHFSSQGISGYSATLIKGDRLLWSYAYGQANREKNIAMTPDHIQNIGSVSKTVTATAIMQLWEAGHFQLDDDINAHLPFSIRNPQFPDEPITFRQLLTHRSSINDGPAYEASYACGDPAVSLEDWITGYFMPDGPYYDEGNFHVWKPGTVDPPPEPRAYTNVGFGVLGYLVEQITGQSFSAYCKEHIFAPLGMERTGWHISEIDVANHSTVYSTLGADPQPPEDGSLDSMLPAEGFTAADLVPNGFVPHCLYSFYNYPDGLVRTSAHDLSRFLRAYANGGDFNDHQLLKAETIDMMLSEDHFGRGLCFDTYTFGTDDTFWGHDGGDPGVATIMCFRKRDQLGLIMFFNQDDFGEGIGEVIRRLLREGEGL